MEWWANNTGLWAAIFTAAAAALGVASWILSGWVADAKDSALREFQDASKAAANRHTEALDTLKNEGEKIQLELSQQRAITAEQQERAAKAEAELLAMKERMAPRALTGNQLTAFSGALKKTAPAVVNLQYLQANDGEPLTLARQLAAALKAVGWKVEGPFAFSQLGGTPPTGLLIGVLDPDKPPAAATALADALRLVGFVSQILVGGSETVFVVRVGAKP